MAMSSKVIISKKPAKFLQKLAKSTPQVYIKIDDFLSNDLPNAQNPCTLPNARHLVGFADNRYRWRLGNFRIIGIVKNGEFYIIEIIKISKRDEKTYK